MKKSSKLFRQAAFLTWTDFPSLSAHVRCKQLSQAQEVLIPTRGWGWGWVATCLSSSEQDKTQVAREGRHHTEPAWRPHLPLLTACCNQLFGWCNINTSGQLLLVKGHSSPGEGHAKLGNKTMGHFACLLLSEHPGLIGH